MNTLNATARVIDTLNRRIGETVAWLALAMVLVQFIVVGMRYVFGIGSIMLQESVIYLHAMIFMIGAGYTLLRDGHVRVDVFYRAASKQTKAVIDVLGAIFLLMPTCAVIAFYSMDYVANSWAVFEGSKETSGIQAVFLLKTVILVFCALVALQGVALSLRALLRLMGARTEPASDDALGQEI